MQTVLQLQEDLGIPVNLDQMDRIYQRCKQFVSASAVDNSLKEEGSSGTGPASAVGMEPAVEAEKRQRDSSTADSGDEQTVIQSGVHQGKTYGWIYKNEAAYTKMIVAKNNGEHLRDPHLISYAIYASHRKRLEKSSAAFMSQSLDINEQSEYMCAVLDTGCNNTCHGDKWMQKHQQLYGQVIEQEPADGKFKGVGGKVEVACKRTIPMKMLTTEQDLVPGSIASVELQDSDAPLLLSVHAQRALGLVLDLRTTRHIAST